MSTATEQHSRAVTVSVPATSANLGPGFDCLGLALDLRNEITFSIAAAGELRNADTTEYTIAVEGVDAGKIPLDSSNLAIAAAETVFRIVGRRPGKVDVCLNNRIPVGSGLGSSSSAIVAGLAAANALVDGDLMTEQLLQLAVEMEGHPDNVAPAMLGGLVLGVLPDSPDGPEQLIVRHWEPPPWTAVVVLPDFHLLTSEARAALPESVARRDAIFNSSRLALLLHAMTTGDPDCLRVAMDDRLHQPYRMRIIPGATEAYRAAYETGAAGVALSGAGPSLIAFTTGDGQPISQAMRGAFAAAGLESRMWLLNPTAEGAVVTRSEGSA